MADSTSDLTKVALAVGGDAVFTTRIQTACTLIGVKADHRLLTEVAYLVVDNITASGTAEDPFIDTSAVTDQSIVAAIESVTSKDETPEEDTDALRIAREAMDIVSTFSGALQYVEDTVTSTKDEITLVTNEVQLLSESMQSIPSAEDYASKDELHQINDDIVRMRGDIEVAKTLGVQASIMMETSA